MIVEGKLLLSVGRIVGVIQVEHDGRRRLRVAVNAVRHQRLGQPLEVLPGHAVFKPRKGRGTRQVLRWRQRAALHTQLKERGVTQAGGIIAVRVAGGDLREPLGQEVAQGVIDVGGMTGVVDSGREACGEAHLAIDATQQEGTKIRGQSTSLKIGTDSLTSNGMKRQVCCSRIG